MHMTTSARIFAGSPHPAGRVIIQLTPGPVCESAQQEGPHMCGHDTCEQIAHERSYGPYNGLGQPFGPDGEDPELFCTVHWARAYYDETQSFSGRGFAGGAICHAVYTCGCRYYDESGDVAAAM